MTKVMTARGSLFEALRRISTSSARLSRRSSGLGRWMRDRKGASAILFALALPGVVGFVGLSFEAALWIMEKRELQEVTDSGSLSGAREFATKDTTRPVTETAAAALEAFRFQPAPSARIVSYKPIGLDEVTASRRASVVRAIRSLARKELIVPHATRTTRVEWSLARRAMPIIAAERQRRGRRFSPRWLPALSCKAHTAGRSEHEPLGCQVASRC